MKQALNPIPSPNCYGRSMTNSSGIRTEQFIFVRGIVGRDPKTNQLVPGGIREQTRQVIESIKLVLEEGGSSLDQVVSALVHLKRREDFVGFDEVWAEYFTKDPPARTGVLAELFLEDSLVEVTCVALA